MPKSVPKTPVEISPFALKRTMSAVAKRERGRDYGHQSEDMQDSLAAHVYARLHVGQ